MKVRSPLLMPLLMSEIARNNNAQLVNLYFIIDSGRFHFLKFILEGYDNLAILSSIDGKRGVVRVKTARESLKELMSVMSDISGDIKKTTI